MANYLYVDNSNVWIEGMHVSAVAHAMVPDICAAQQSDVCDRDWRMDFGRLYEFAGGDASDVGRAVLYGSRPPENDSLWDVARRKGFEVVVHDRNFNNREKKVDTNIATDMMSDSYERMVAGDEMTLVSGDADFVPTVENLRTRGFRVTVVFWRHASAELRSVASRFVSLDPYLQHLRLTQADGRAARAILGRP